jgi:DNA-binding transcriptional MerR regulator
MFRQAYKDWTVDVTERGNVRVMSPKGAVALVRARKKPKNNEERASFGREVLAHLFDKGLVKTVKKYKALRAPKLAQLLDSALSGMKDHQSKPNDKAEISGDGLTGMADSAIYGDVYSNNTLVTSDGVRDMDDAPAGEGADEIQLGGDADHKTNIPDDTGLQVTNDELSGMGPGARKPFNLNDDVANNGGVVDHKNVPFKPSASKRKAFKVVARSWLENNREAKRSDMETWLATPDGNGAYALVREDEDTRRATISELRKAWMALDAIPEAASQRVAGRVNAEKSVDRVKKLYEQRFEALKKEASEAIEHAQAKTIDHFCRAIRVASHRQAIGLEDCKLKEAFATALANDRIVGADSDGCELVYTAMTPELAVHLTESAWAEGSEGHLNNLLSRAAELASRSPEYLRDAEADLKKHSHRIASVNQSTLVSETTQNNAVAEEVREAALSGNLALNAAPPVSKKPTNGHNKSASIRSALSATRTNAYTRQIRS